MTLRLSKLYPSLDLFAGLVYGLIVLSLATTDLSLPRTVFGFPYIFFVVGYPLASIFNFNQSPAGSRFLAASVFSLLLLYPAGVLTTVFEGQTSQAIYQSHLSNSLFSLFLLHSFTVLMVAAYRIKRRLHPPQLILPRPNPFLAFSLIIFALLTLTNLNRADVFGDEYDLGYQAYNLIDGIFVGRKAYTISFNTHPPAIFHIKHFTMQLLNPNGLDALADWQFRVTESILGLLAITFTYVLAKRHLGTQVAIVAALILSTNNYMIFMGRFFERSIYLTPFAMASVFWILEHSKSKQKQHLVLTVVSLAGAFLVKISALPLLMAIVLFLLKISKPGLKSFGLFVTILVLVYSPVVVYNLAAYFTHNLADSTFSRILGLDHPFATDFPPTPLLTNPPVLVSLLVDLYSFPVFLVFLLAVTFAISTKPKPKLIYLLLLWLGFSSLFFISTTLRSYYLVFFTPALAILSAIFLNTLHQTRRWLAKFTLLSLSVYSLLYAYKTNLDSDYSILPIYNDVGSSSYGPVPLDPNRHFSLAARSWTESRGWKVLVSQLDQAILPQDCLSVDPLIRDNLAVRRYLLTNDAVKKHYFGEDYPRRYPDCSLQVNPNNAYLLTQRPLLQNQPIQIIQDQHQNTPFYLYRK